MFLMTKNYGVPLFEDEYINIDHVIHIEIFEEHQLPLAELKKMNIKWLAKIKVVTGDTYEIIGNDYKRLGKFRQALAHFLLP